MTDAASRTSPSDAAGPRPTLLPVAAGLVGVTALMSLLLSVVLYAYRPLVGCLIAANEKKITATDALRTQVNACVDGVSGSALTRASDSKVSSALTTNLVQGVLFAVIFAAVAWFLLQGRPIMRWVVVGLWVLSNLIGLSGFGLLGAINTARAGVFPAGYVGILLVGAITLTAAAVIVNVPVVSRYFNARRPVRTVATRPGGPGAGARPAGGLLGGLFGPRATPGGTTRAATGGPTSSSSRGTSGSGSGSGRVDLGKGAKGSGRPASTRPAKGAGGTAGGSGAGRPTGGATAAGGRPSRPASKSRGSKRP